MHHLKMVPWNETCWKQMFYTCNKEAIFVIAAIFYSLYYCHLHNGVNQINTRQSSLALALEILLESWKIIYLSIGCKLKQPHP